MFDGTLSPRRAEAARRNGLAFISAFWRQVSAQPRQPHPSPVIVKVASNGLPQKWHGPSVMTGHHRLALVTLVNSVESVADAFSLVWGGAIC